MNKYSEVKRMDSSYPWLDKGSQFNIKQQLDRTLTERKELRISSPL